MKPSHVSNREPRQFVASGSFRVGLLGLTTAAPRTVISRLRQVKIVACRYKHMTTIPPRSLAQDAPARPSGSASRDHGGCVRAIVPSTAPMTASSTTRQDPIPSWTSRAPHSSQPAAQVGEFPRPRVRAHRQCCLARRRVQSVVLSFSSQIHDIDLLDLPLD